MITRTTERGFTSICIITAQRKGQQMWFHLQKRTHDQNKIDYRKIPPFYDSFKKERLRYDKMVIKFQFRSASGTWLTKFDHVTVIKLHHVTIGEGKHCWCVSWSKVTFTPYTPAVSKMTYLLSGDILNVDHSLWRCIYATMGKWLVCK